MNTKSLTERVKKLEQVSKVGKSLVIFFVEGEDSWEVREEKRQTALLSHLAAHPEDKGKELNFFQVSFVDPSTPQNKGPVSATDKEIIDRYYEDRKKSEERGKLSPQEAYLSMLNGP